MSSSISSEKSIISAPGVEFEQGGGRKQEKETERILKLEGEVRELKDVVRAKDSELQQVKRQLDEVKNGQIAQSNRLAQLEMDDRIRRFSITLPAPNSEGEIVVPNGHKYTPDIEPFIRHGAAYCHGMRSLHAILDCQQNDGKRQKARECVNRYMAITGAPGVSIGVAKNGKTIWAEGFGYADVETGAKCTGESVMRIASISKPLTATIVGRLMEKGKLDIDRDIHEYLSQKDFPKKSFNGKEVAITARQLLSHISGVRHYPKNNELAPVSKDPAEFMSNKRFSTVSEALGMFKDDPLLAAPGAEFHYTTHGYTLLSAVAEKAAGREFKEQLDELFTRLEMCHTFLEIAQEPIVVERTRYYKRNDQTHRLENVREVDNSYKLAGGGILSNVGDLLKFANGILYSYQLSPIQQTRRSRPLLKSETIRKMWTKHSEDISKEGKKLAEYGLGWFLAYPNGWDGGEEANENGGEEAKKNINGGHDFEERKYWFHTGAAVGASSTLLIKPCQKSRALMSGADVEEFDPQGICIAILVNCQNCRCNGLAIELTNIFKN